MNKRLNPHNEKEVKDLICAAINDKKSIEVVGAGSKRNWGRPNQSSELLNLSQLSGITLYEPQELVMTASAGTPIADIREILSDNQQHLAFEPPDLSLLYGGGKDNGTLGGVVATNLSGPRRIQSGAVRDYCLGFEAISARGNEFKSGGRVVKNVTGFDLSKLLAGSFGTLAVMVSITIKILPKPEKTRTILVFGLENERGISSLSEILNGPYEINAAAHLPSEIAKNSSISLVNSSLLSVTAIRLQGSSKSVMARLKEVRSLCRIYGEVEELHSHNSSYLWKEIGEIGSLLNNKSDQIWRILVAPSEGASIVKKIRRDAECKVYFDWGGGLIWLAADQKLSGVGSTIRKVLQRTGGHATLMRGSSDLRMSTDVFQPLAPANKRLTKLIKNNFDPFGVLNPGRMYEDI